MKNVTLNVLIMSSISIGSVCAAQGGTQDFLDHLRDYESGVNPNQSEYYHDNLNNAVYDYAQVTEPGHLVRDCSTGKVITEPTTINEYFIKLGIRSLYNPDTPDDPVMFRSMQYNSINPWGFVGYQLGEALLIDAGYYSPPTVTIDGNEYDSFYMFVPDSTWIGCRTEALAEIEGSGGNKVYVTDTNRWAGKFVGKNGINSFSDLVIPEKQELVIRDAMHFNYSIISKQLANAGMTWTQALSKSWQGVDEDGQPVTIRATMSGILAAAHLSGAWGVASLLIDDDVACDEQGTCITKYMYKFGGYDTLFDVPGDSVSYGSEYDEVLTAGWGNDTVILGGGSNQLLLNKYPGGVTTITDFSVGSDLIVLRGWDVESPLDDLTISQQDDGTHLQFSQQVVVLQNVSASDVQSNIDSVITESRVYVLDWNSGAHAIDGFNPKVDRIEGSSGIGFKHLKAYETEGSVVIGPQAADGGIYSSYKLNGLSINDITSDMFINVSGSFERLGYIVLLDWVNWPYNGELIVDYFDVNKTVITLPSGRPIPFDLVKLTQDGSDVVMTSYEDPEDHKTLILKNVNVLDLNGANFSGFTGSYDDVTIELL